MYIITYTYKSKSVTQEINALQWFPGLIISRLKPASCFVLILIASQDISLSVDWISTWNVFCFLRMFLLNILWLLYKCVTFIFNYTNRCFKRCDSVILFYCFPVLKSSKNVYHADVRRFSTCSIAGVLSSLVTPRHIRSNDFRILEI